MFLFIRKFRIQIVILVKRLCMVPWPWLMRIENESDMKLYEVGLSHLKRCLLRINPLNNHRLAAHHKIKAQLGKTSMEKKRFLSGIARMRGGGVYPCPIFLALFQEVHFWSIKRVYFFKNANVLNF